VGIDELRDPQMTVIYGEDSCEDTTRARESFDAAGRAYRYVRLDQDAATRQRLHDADYLSTPVILTPAGGIFMEPSDEELVTILAATA
jgi:glutaredoxin